MGRYAKRNKNLKKRKLKDQIYDVLTSKFNSGKGRSRHKDKESGLDAKYIYTDKTYYTYMEQSKRFASWCMENHPEARTLKDCRKYVDEYLQKYITDGKSPWTIKTIACALSKLYGVSTTEFIATPSRTRAEIVRSRKDVNYGRHISAEMEQQYAKITSATGLRRREMLKIRGESLFYDKDGNPWINISDGTKGGKPRTAPVIGTKEEKAAIVELFTRAGTQRVVPYLPKTYDNHHYRGVYATRLYNQLARPIETIPHDEKYFCRNELKGVVYDKRAMQEVSKALGHTRVTVIASSYLYAPE